MSTETGVLSLYVSWIGLRVYLVKYCHAQENTAVLNYQTYT